MDLNHRSKVRGCMADNISKIGVREVNITEALNAQKAGHFLGDHK